MARSKLQNNSFGSVIQSSAVIRIVKTDGSSKQSRPLQGLATRSQDTAASGYLESPLVSRSRSLSASTESSRDLRKIQSFRYAATTPDRLASNSFDSTASPVQLVRKESVSENSLRKTQSFMHKPTSPIDGNYSALFTQTPPNPQKAPSRVRIIAWCILHN